MSHHDSTRPAGGVPLPPCPVSGARAGRLIPCLKVKPWQPARSVVKVLEGKGCVCMSSRLTMRDACGSGQSEWLPGGLGSHGPAAPGRPGQCAAPSRIGPAHTACGSRPRAPQEHRRARRWRVGSAVSSRSAAGQQPWWARESASLGSGVSGAGDPRCRDAEKLRGAEIPRLPHSRRGEVGATMRPWLAGCQRCRRVARVLPW